MMNRFDQPPAAKLTLEVAEATTASLTGSRKSTEYPEVAEVRSPKFVPSTMKTLLTVPLAASPPLMSVMVGGGGLESLPQAATNIATAATVATLEPVKSSPRMLA